MSEFKKRHAKGEELYNELLLYMSINNIEYFLTGYENLSATQNAKTNIIRNNSNTSLFVRHYPDITTTFEKETMLIEVKNSSGIEYNAYKTYMLLAENSNLNFYLFLRNRKFCKIQDLKFNAPAKYCDICKLNIPIKDNYFRAPEQLDYFEYLQYKEAYSAQGKTTSGNSFAFIDFDNTKFYDIDVIVKLKDKHSL